MRCLPLVVFLTGLGVASPAPEFDSAILPLFKARCAACHGEAAPQAGLNLTKLNSILKGGKSGPAIVAGSSDRSLLVEKVASGAMPPVDPKLTADEIHQIRLWIDEFAASETAPMVAASITEKDVLPIFQTRCIACHGKRKQEAGLDLRTQASRLKGGKSGPALVPGRPEESLLLHRVETQEMPPAKLLQGTNIRPPPSEEVETLRRWIAAGCQPAPAEPVFSVDNDPLVGEEDRQFWSFQPPKRPVVPEVKHAGRVRSPVDAFLLRKLEEKDLSFAPEAERLVLLRRAYLDLIGMPPTPEELEQYLADTKPEAYEQLIDRLLESPRYGERWAQFWLDLAGYSDSEGIIDADKVRVHSWRYRDFVIRAFNADMPYDEFLTKQLAGDELFDYKNVETFTPEMIDTLAATGFLRLAPDGTYSPANGSVAERMDVIADEMHVLGSTVLGLTVGCARCHDHKYDPLPQRDYYRLSAVFQAAFDPYDWLDSANRYLDAAVDAEREEVETFNKPIDAEIERLEKDIEKKAAPLREELLTERFESLPEEIRKDLKRLTGTPDEERTSVQKYLAEKFDEVLKVSDEDLTKRFPEYKEPWEAATKAITELKDKRRPEPKIRAVFDMGGAPSPVYILQRGEARALGKQVQPGVPSVFRVGLQPYRPAPPWEGDTTSGNRLALARWLTQSNHPLTARVLVNRLWLEHFGRGIVSSPSNFGRTGVPPSHPELLDWLATELIRQGWSIKDMHRLMMTSSAYRQRSRAESSASSLDPDNLLLSRMPLQRMDAETLHDSILSVTGRLDPKPFGPPVDVEVRDSGEIVAKGTKDGWRRAVYVLHRRKTPPTILDVFDLPQLNPNCTERAESTVATQALQIRNGETVRQHARYLAGRLVDEFPDDSKRRVEQAYLRVLSRPPSAEETRLALQDVAKIESEWMSHLEAERRSAPRSHTAQWSAWASLCHAMLSSGEFLHID